MAKTFDELVAGANKIRTNELPESNTHGLVGEQILQMVSKQIETDKKVDDNKKSADDNLKTVKENLESGLAQLGAKMGPSELPTVVSNLYSEHGHPTSNGYVPTALESELCSGIISVSEGDVIDCIGAFTHVSLYDANMGNRNNSIAYPVTVPKGYVYAVIPYMYNNTGAGIDCVVTHIKNKISAKAVGFINNENSNDKETVDSSFVSKINRDKYSKVKIGKNKFDKDTALFGLASGAGFDPSVTTLKTNSVLVSKTEYTVQRVRTYRIEDINGKSLGGAYIDPTNTYTISMPDNSYKLLCSAYIADLDKTMVEEGLSASDYEKFAIDLEYDEKSFLNKKFDEIKSQFSVLSGDRTIYEYPKFELGTISGSGDLLDATNRVRANIALVDGIEYTWSIADDGYSLLAMFCEDSNGIITSCSISNKSVTGSENRKFLHFVLKRIDSGVIYPADVEGDKVLVACVSNNKSNLEGLSQVLALQNTQLISINNSVKLDLQYANKENDKLIANLDLANKNLKSLLKQKKSGTWDSATFTVPEKSKVILNLHRRVNEGFNTINDAYLPLSETDFSDIRVIGDGKYLPYQFVYRGNIDIIADNRLAGESLIYVDSNNKMFGKKENTIQTSIDGGKTWTRLTAFSSLSSPTVAYVSKDDTLLVGSAGKLYRSIAPYTSYTEVLDWNTYHSGSTILTHSMIQHPDGDMFIGLYNSNRDIRIKKSTDDGITWTDCYTDSSGKYQHVHNMSIDINQKPIAIYAGLDGGGGILKTIDKGETWTDLRTNNPNIPQSSDYGIIYSDPSGYRLSGGETSIVGGYSILKTTDDVNFRPVLSTGKAVYFVKKINGLLIATGLASKAFKTSEVYVSDDEGETWTTAYATSTFIAEGASDGFRYISQGLYQGASDEQLIIGCQGGKSPLRMYAGGNNYYAEIIVDIPKGVTSITVENGYLCSNECIVKNDSEIGSHLFRLPFDCKYDIYNGELKEYDIYNGELKEYDIYNGAGKRLGNIYPYIQPLNNSVILREGMYFKKNLPLNYPFTISYWGNTIGNNEFNFIRRGNNRLRLVNGYQLWIDNTIILSYYHPVVCTDSKFDLVFTSNEINIYQNGILVGNKPNTYADIASLTGDIVILEVTKDSGNSSAYMQDFSIRGIELSAEQALIEYFDRLTDLM